MHASDRRLAPRFRINIPLHFRLATSSHSQFEWVAETRDVSSSGICMETDAPPKVGNMLVVTMRLPEMIVGWRVPEWRITAHVVHVETIGDPGKFGVGVQFHFYEVMSPHRGRSLFESTTGAQLIANQARVAAVSGVRL
jgi:hypothetical protein